MDFFKTLFGASPQDNLTEEQVRDLCKRDRKVELIDVRTLPEYKMEHINPCRNIDFKAKDFSDKVKYLDKSRTYILYCKSGKRSKKALSIMSKMGFENLYSLSGGIQSWEGNKRVK